MTGAMTETQTPEPDCVQLGREALERLRDREGKNWDDWTAVGLALEVGRKRAEYESGKSRGSRYSKAMGRWIDEHGFRDMDESDRAKLLKVIEKRAEIEDWRAGLSDAERRKLNHPATVWRNWPGSKKQSAPKSKPAQSKASLQAVELVAVVEAENQELRQEREQRDRVDRDWLLGASVAAVAKEIVDVMSPEWVRELVAALGEVIEGEMTEPPTTPVSRLGDVILLGAKTECPKCGETTPVGVA
jgi:hypothetical protein